MVGIPNRVEAQSLLVDYRFDGPYTQTTVDSSGNVLDGNLGLSNQVEAQDPTQTAGVVGGGLYFDGNDDLVSLPQNASLDNLLNFTLEAWIYPTSYFDAFGQLSEIFNKGSNKKRFFINSAVGTLGGLVGFSDGNKPATTYTSTPIALNQWSHVVMVYSNSTKKITIYVNGVASVNAKQTAGGGTILADSNSSPANWVVGSYGASGNFLNGKLDGVRVYNKALTSAEVLAQYNTFTANDVVSPTISITSPIQGATISGIKILTADAGDNIGVTGVRFKVDGVNLGTEDTTFPFARNLDSTTLADGTHTISATVRDKKNKTATNSITITVDNSQINTRKNVVIINTDDQRWDAMGPTYMPLTNALFANSTVKFNNMTVSNPVCCPSRASLFNGLYAHNHKVMTVSLGTSFDDRETLATWAENAGYRTGLIGKYMVAYLDKLSQYVPRGWTEWQAFAKPGNLFSNYTLNQNGLLVNYGTGDQNYSTNVLAAKAVSFIETTPSSQPFLLYFTPSAPHAPAIPALSEKGKFNGIAPWRPPSYNEADVSDKPAWARKLPLMSAAKQASVDSLRQNQLEASLSVDKAVQDIFDALTRTGRIDDTIVVYTSDNGKSWGEHRWDDKECPWEECIRVPLWIRLPGIVSNTNDDLVQNIDLVPTITELLNLTPTRTYDGKSLVNILQGQQTTPLRSELFMEFGGVKDGTRTVVESGFNAVRDNQYTYAEYANGDRELYDLIADPYQLENIINDPTKVDVINSLKTKLSNYINN